MSNDVYQAGKLVERWDDATRTYTSWDSSGVQTSSRSYTPAENATADTNTAIASAATARTANRTAVKQIITDLQAEKDRMDPVIAKTNAQITGADTKDVARAAKRIADAAIELARFVQEMP